MQSRPLRIGMYSSSLPEPGRKPGGVDVLIHRLANRLVERGNEVRIWTYSPAPPGAHYAVEQLEPADIARSRVRRLTVAPARLNRVGFAGVDVLHLHGDDWFFLRRQLPTVRTLYGSALYEMRYATSIRRRLSQAALVPMEALACELATLAYGMIPGDGPAHRLDGFLPGAAEAPGEPSPARSEAPSILFVGTWLGRKRGKVLVDAFLSEVLPAVPGAQLWCVSDHCEPSASVHWIKTPTDAELADLYRKAWVFCLPSLYEGFGLPYLEAMAAGTPVITSSNPGARYVTQDGTDGVITADGELGRALTRLLTDASLREHYRDLGLRRAREFTWDRAAERHEEAYASAIGKFALQRR